MSDMHIYRTKEQKATRYKCDAGFVVRYSPTATLWANCCRRLRWAKNLTVQSYYDGDRFFCIKGKGCKP